MNYIQNIKKLPRKSGIYRVYTNFNKACYIGQAIDIYKRFNSHHIYDYKNPKSSCYNTKFYSALRKHGLEAFEVEVLELCPIEELNQKEIYYIAKYDSFHHGYNSTLGGQAITSHIHDSEVETKRQRTRERNQSLKGEKHPRAKLTNKEVILIRRRYIAGESCEQIYQDYKDIYSSLAAFKRVVLGYTYKNVDISPSSTQIRYTNAKFTDAQIRDIRKRYQTERISYAKLGAEYNVSETTIAGIIKNKTYKHVK